MSAASLLINSNLLLLLNGLLLLVFLRLGRFQFLLDLFDLLLLLGLLLQLFFGPQDFRKLSHDGLYDLVLLLAHSTNEAMALGDRVFVLAQGHIVAQGTPLDVSSEPHQLALARLTRVKNILTATVESHSSTEGVTVVRIVGGPALRVPLQESPPGSTLTFGLRADDILLARQAVPGISAQNLLEGRVAEIVRHGADIEVLIDCGTRFVASIVPASIASLGLAPGAPVCMIVKALSCHLLRSDEK